jgi:hypothetical protein
MNNTYSLFLCEDIRTRFCNVLYRFKKILLTLITFFILLNLLGCGSESIHHTGNSSDTDSIYHESVTLSWAAPTSDANGSVLNDLAGYRIYYGRASMDYTQSIDAGNFTGTVINNLSPGTWCFTVTAYDTSGNESNTSQELCTTL